MLEQYRIKKAIKKQEKANKQTQKLKVKLAYVKFLIVKDEIENNITPINQEPQTTNQEAQTSNLSQRLFESVEQKTYRYFLKDEDEKESQTEKLKKLSGEKITWARSKSGLKNWYVKSIGSKSNNVEIIMAQLPNMGTNENKFFNRSPWKAQFWEKSQ